MFLAAFMTESSSSERLYRSSWSIGVLKAWRSWVCSSRRTWSASCSAARTPVSCAASPWAQAANAAIPVTVMSAWAARVPRTSGVSGRNQCDLIG